MIEQLHLGIAQLGIGQPHLGIVQRHFGDRAAAFGDRAAAFGDRAIGDRAEAFGIVVLGIVQPSSMWKAEPKLKPISDFCNVKINVHTAVGALSCYIWILTRLTIGSVREMG